MFGTSTELLYILAPSLKIFRAFFLMKLFNEDVCICGAAMLYIKLSNDVIAKVIQACVRRIVGLNLQCTYRTIDRKRVNTFNRN